MASQWANLAESLANKPDAYQLVLQEGTATATTAASALAAAPGKTLLDAELLLRARRVVTSQPAAACEALLLLMERSLMKEQLAAGLLQQEGLGSSRVSSSGAAGRDRSSSVDGQAAGAAPAGLEPWAKVRPLPPGVFVAKSVGDRDRLYSRVSGQLCQVGMPVTR